MVQHPVHQPKRRVRASIFLVATMIASTALVGAGAGAAQASVPAKAVTKCVNVKTGVARVIKRHGKCRKGERKITVTVTVTPKTCATGGPCVLGDIGPGGGKVFLDAGSAQPWGRYLEAAPANWNAGGAEPLAQWCNLYEGSIPGVSGFTIGTGEANTNAMVAACSSGAAVLARAYTGGGQNDWFLPSADEVKLMTTTRGGKADVGLTTSIYYWTSTQARLSFEGVAMDSVGTVANLSKASKVAFRPIRAF
jgi:hypothetical protein